MVELIITVYIVTNTDSYLAPLIVLQVDGYVFSYSLTVKSLRICGKDRVKI